LVGPCTQIGHALGIAVDLPDLVDRTETAALLRPPTDTWKDAFEGCVADTMRNGDRCWIRLADYGFGRAFLDVEEGIKFSTTVAGLADCLAFIASLTELCQSALNSFQGTACKTFHFVSLRLAAFCAV